MCSVHWCTRRNGTFLFSREQSWSPSVWISAASVSTINSKYSFLLLLIRSSLLCYWAMWTPSLRTVLWREKPLFIMTWISVNTLMFLIYGSTTMTRPSRSFFRSWKTSSRSHDYALSLKSSVSIISSLFQVTMCVSPSRILFVTRWITTAQTATSFILKRTKN